MGRIAMPTLVAQAASPLIGTWLLQNYGPSGMLSVLCSFALLVSAGLWWRCCCPAYGFRRAREVGRRAAGAGTRAQACEPRGPNRMIAAPTMAMNAPRMSQRSGRAPSIIQPHRRAVIYVLDPTRREG